MGRKGTKEIKTPDKKNWRPLSEDVEILIMEYIHKKHLKPGDLLPTEEEFAAMFNVSRRVIRETISRLRSMGLLVSKKRLGTIVAKPSIFDVMGKMMTMSFWTDSEKDDFFLLRLIIELGLPDILIQNISDDDIAALEQIVEKEESAPADRALYLECDYHFHMRLYQSVGCRALSSLQGVLYIFFSDMEKQPLNPMSENRFKDKGTITHRDILEAIKKRDAQKLRELIYAHLSWHLASDGNRQLSEINK